MTEGRDLTITKRVANRPLYREKINPCRIQGEPAIHLETGELQSDPYTGRRETPTLYRGITVNLDLKRRDN